MAEDMTLREIFETVFSRRFLFTTELSQTTCCLKTNLPFHTQTFIFVLNSQAISSFQQSLFCSKMSLILKEMIYVFSVSL